MAAKKRGGFTLIETALAIGIVAFALIPVVGLLPLGLQTSRQASDLTISAQIAQRLVGMVQQADYSAYSKLMGVYYYFDADGQPVTITGNVFPPSVVYSASIPTPPSIPASLVDNSNVATLNIQIVNDRAHRLQGTPSTSLPPDMKSQAVLIPIYLANNGG